MNGRPYTFLDDAPLEERRTRAVTTRRGLPLEARDLSALDPATVAGVVEQATPELRSAEELHDLLCSLVVCPPRPEWTKWMDELVKAGRAMSLELAGSGTRWVAVEQRELASALFEGATFDPDLRLDSAHPQARLERDDALVVAARGHLEILGPVTAGELSASIGTGGEGEIRSALARLVGEGSVLACRIAEPVDAGDSPAERFCTRHLLARIHSAMRDRTRRSFEAVSAQEFMRFLIVWQHVGAPNRLLGSGGVVEVIEQLQGYEAAVDAWESSILPARVAGYHAALLDEWCARGEVSFGRLTLRSADRLGSVPRRGGATPSAATPVSLFRRDDLDWLLVAARRRRGCRATDRRSIARGFRGAAAPRCLVRDRHLPIDRSDAGRGGRGALGRDGPGPSHRGRFPGRSSPVERAGALFQDELCHRCNAVFAERARPVAPGASETGSHAPPGASRLVRRSLVDARRWAFSAGAFAVGTDRGSGL